MAGLIYQINQIIQQLCDQWQVAGKDERRRLGETLSAVDIFTTTNNN